MKWFKRKRGNFLITDRVDWQKQVLKDILALTKLNYNACIYADGEPVTLRFADKIGEILTASNEIQAPP